MSYLSQTPATHRLARCSHSQLRVQYCISHLRALTATKTRPLPQAVLTRMPLATRLVLRGMPVFSAFAVKVSPLAGLNEVGPVEGMEFWVSLEHVELDRSQGGSAAYALF